MITEYIRYRIPDGQGSQFEDAYRRAGAVLSESPQCVGWDVARCVDEPSCYVVRIRWTSAEDHLTGFRSGPRFPAFFAEVKPFVGDIEEMRHYGELAAGDGPPTLYDWAGGEEALTRLTAAFYREVLKDDVLEPLFRGMSPDHPRRVAHWLGEVFGGPRTYSAERGGYSTMLAMHLGKAITERQRRRWVSLLQDAADEVGLPADPEFRAAFTGYLEWGTRIALANSQPDADPVKQAPVPRWGWGVAVPLPRVPRGARSL
ncbi:antibiotic biosynthesis monooxygenase [Kutzneria kofuensis]|uniref:Truncated hemoglobin YjbI n=1 Tax=Kutzneria kofuensis TaxID=103725 RepID=A0A7W9NGK3_9PSEU|nr:antibiotic biosynthesis monooxygenase [Kutzneria kofuensis]MBB5891173.1 truncated hemoglobin YjbI [Kutzneria kofuensis]